MPLHGGLSAARRLHASQGDEVDSALENLGFSYLDGIPFVLDPRLSSTLSAVETHLAKAKELVEEPVIAPRPGEFDVSHVGRLEKQVLEQLQRLDLEREERRKREEDILREYREEKEKKRIREEQEAKAREEEDLKRQAEEESKKTAEEAAKNEVEEKASRSSSTEDVSAASTQPARSPSLDLRSNNPIALGQNSVAPVPNVNNPFMNPIPPRTFNFREFEREVDPFERAELETINDMQELAAVLQTTQSSTVNNSTPPVPTTNFQQYYRAPEPTAASAMPSYMPSQSTNPFLQYPQGQVRTPYFPQYRPAVQEVQEEGSLKNSKSVGDLMSEIEKDAEKMSFETSPKATPRLNSRTPPPTNEGKRAVSSAMNEWIPWPDLDGSSSSKSKEQEKSKEDIILSNLSPDIIQRCRRVHDMGFPLDRVVRICKSTGADEQQSINFCLLVDKLNEEKVYGDVGNIEHVVMLYSLDETQSRKHLECFNKLLDFGFPKEKIHEALSSNNLDYNKALEKLLSN